MPNARERQLQEIARLKAALLTTSSEYLKKDYSKAIRRMENELKEYDRLFGKE